MDVILINDTVYYMILSKSLQRDFCGDLNEFGLSDDELLPSIYHISTCDISSKPLLS